MSEYLLESGHGGSIANVAYSPCGVNSTSQLLYGEYLDNLFRGESCLGRAVFAAKCSVIARYPASDYLYGPAVLWTLFGDPALRVKHHVASGMAESQKPQAQGPDLTATPNPCDASVRVSFSSPLQTAGRSLVTVHDASGRLVSSQTFRGSPFVLPTSPLPSGVYFVRCAPGTYYQTGASLASSLSVRLLVQHP